MGMRRTIDILEMVQDAFAHHELFVHYCGHFNKNPVLRSEKVFQFVGIGQSWFMSLIGNLLFFLKFVASLPDFTYALNPFFPRRKNFTVPFIKFVTIIALKDEIYLRVINFFVFPLRNFRHKNLIRY